MFIAACLIAELLLPILGVDAFVDTRHDSMLLVNSCAINGLGDFYSIPES